MYSCNFVAQSNVTYAEIGLPKQTSPNPEQNLHYPKQIRIYARLQACECRPHANPIV